MNTRIFNKKIAACDDLDDYVQLQSELNQLKKYHTYPGWRNQLDQAFRDYLELVFDCSISKSQWKRYVSQSGGDFVTIYENIPVD